MAYGRNVTASRGPGIQYDVAAKSAESFLESTESSQYQSALGTMGRERAGKGSGRGNTWSGSRQHVSKLLKKDRLQREKAESQASDLRNVAASRALGEFRQAGTKTSKPWLRTASEGLISGQSVTAPLDLETLYHTRKKGPGAKDRMTKHQKKRVGDIAKYTNFQYGAIGLPGQAVRSNAGPVGATPSQSNTAPVDTGYTQQPWMEGLTDQAVQDILNQNVPSTTAPTPTPAPGSPAPSPVDTGTGSGNALQDLIDQIHKDNLAGLTG